jgi:toxin YoeB
MDKKTIIWSLKAKEEFQKILEFYIQRNNSPTYSLKLMSETEEIMKLLGTYHYLGRCTDNQTTRVIIKVTFLLFYEICKDTIEIVSYWDNRQNPENRIIR